MTDSYSLDDYLTDEDIIRKIQTGKGDSTFIFYGYKNLFVEQMFKGTWPSTPEQDVVTGRNNLYAAKMARYEYKVNRDTMPPEEGYD